MNYIGSKVSLLDFLDSSIEQVAGKRQQTFCDIFAGTGAVGVRFKKKGYRIIANDIQYFSYVLNRHFIGNSRELRFTKLASKLPEIKKVPAPERAAAVCDYLSRLPGVKGFIYQNYCLGGTYEGERRQYFSDENGQKCDAIRQFVEKWHQKKLITDNEYYFLVATLIETVDKYANTASVYGAFLKRLKTSAGRSLVLKPLPLIESKQTHRVFNQDVNHLARHIECDILYLDPPYNQRQYATNYHLLETIARYDNPIIHGKTGLREYQAQKSLYCSRRHVKEVFSDLITSARAKYIFLSYNNEGLMTPAEIKAIMSTRGRYGYFTRQHNRFRADTMLKRPYKTTKTIEYLHYVVCR